MEGNVHLVLFGLPSAGKSALLGILAEAARSQETLLNGRLAAPALDELHRHVYENSIQPTAEEVVKYPVSFESKSAPVEAVLLDSSGQSASELLQKSGNGPLKKEVQNADTLILVADGSADTAQLQRDFGRFALFLRQFEQTRSERTEVAGLPVYLVLTKCDLLAKKTDTTAAWIQRIEERKRQIDQGFQKFLSQQAEREGLAFGKLDYHVWATAVGRPALADRPARPQEPYGVAELFRQCLDAADKFHRARRKSAQRLRITAFAAAGLVTVMLLSALGIYVTRPSAEVIALENSLHGVLPPRNAAPAERLKEPLDKKLVRLRQVQQNADFDKLPAATRHDVADHIKEVEAYLKYNDAFLKKVRDPRFATREDDLKLIEDNLKTVPLPERYAAEWKDTRAGHRPEVWAKDIQVLRKEIGNTEKWIDEQILKGKDLKKEGYRLLGTAASGKERAAWLEQYKKYMSQEYPNKPRKLLPGASTITYDTVYRFDRVVRARTGLHDFKKTLRDSVYRDIKEQGE